MQHGEGMWVCVGAILDIFTWNPSEILQSKLQKLQDIVKTLTDKNEVTDCRGEMKVFFNFIV